MSVHLQVTGKIVNPTLSRKELELKIVHTNACTPKKEIITKELSLNYGIPLNQIYVFGMKTGFGIHVSTAKANLYDSFEAFLKIERKFVLKRNKISLGILNQPEGEERFKPLRRMRKEIRKKNAKTFGTAKRILRKLEKKQKND